MILSNNALKYFDVLPTGLVIRINVAWQTSLAELKTIIDNSTHPIYLDYPSGRTKPPKPEISLDDVIALLTTTFRVKYFAFSNAESPTVGKELRKRIPAHIKLVPKIETVSGVHNMLEICTAAETDMVNLDHEDLYVNVNHDSTEYNKYMNEVLRLGKENNIKVYKVQGIIFGECQ